MWLVAAVPPDSGTDAVAPSPKLNTTEPIGAAPVTVAVNVTVTPTLTTPGFTLSVVLLGPAHADDGRPAAMMNAIISAGTRLTTRRPQSAPRAINFFNTFAPNHFAVRHMAGGIVFQRIAQLQTGRFPRAFQWRTLVRVPGTSV
jgi:hypothetical protein